MADPHASEDHSDMEGTFLDSDDHSSRNQSQGTTLEPSQSAACAAVFGTVELLEQILLEGQFFELLKHLRVCRGWNAVITQSSRLRRVLFLAPEVRRGRLLKWVPSPMAGYPGERDTNPTIIRDAPGARSHRTAVVAHLNPWFKITPGLRREKRKLTFDIQPKPYLECDLGLWNDAYITQPPATAVVVNYGLGVKLTGGFKVDHVVVQNGAGVTLGDVANALWVGLKRLKVTRSSKLHASAVRWGEMAALISYNKTDGLDQLEFDWLIGTIRGFIARDSPWVREAKNRDNAEATAAAEAEALLAKSETDEGDRETGGNDENGGNVKEGSISG